MSRIGKQPVPVPPSVQVQVEGTSVTVRGPKGELHREVHQDNAQLIVPRPSDQPRHRALHGLSRALLANMVAGVESGFSKTLELHGVGYRAQQMGENLQLSVGFSHPVEGKPPPGITLEVAGPT